MNLRHGLKSQKLEWSRETCTACAGTMVLEMAALSRLTGEPIFEVYYLFLAINLIGPIHIFILTLHSFLVTLKIFCKVLCYLTKRHGKFVKFSGFFVK